MNMTWKMIIWQQFGAAIDMFDDAVRACPDELWHHRLWHNPDEPPAYAEFWLIAFHTLFWLDLYLSGTAEGFAPPDRFAGYEKDANGVPTTPFKKEDIQAYLSECRQKCRTTIEALTEETAQRRCQFRWGEVSFLELLLYNMRHVQEHAAQLSLVLGQKKVESELGWVCQARS